MTAKKKAARVGAKRASTIEFPFSVLGDEPRTVRIHEGTTLEALRARLNLKGQTIKVNGAKVEESYVIRAGDQVVAVPQVKGGLSR